MHEVCHVSARRLADFGRVFWTRISDTYRPAHAASTKLWRPRASEGRCKYRIEAAHTRERRLKCNIFRMRLLNKHVANAPISPPAASICYSVWRVRTSVEPECFIMTSITTLRLLRIVNSTGNTEHSICWLRSHISRPTAGDDPQQCAYKNINL